jgi:fluoride exporter
MDKFMPFLWVGLGGYLGCLSRYGLSLALKNISLALPYGTLCANLLACVIIGIVTELGSRTGLLSAEIRLLLVTRFCGGLSTMSSFMYEFGQLIRSAEYFRALLYLKITLLASFLCYAVGTRIFIDEADKAHHRAR